MKHTTRNLLLLTGAAGALAAPAAASAADCPLQARHAVAEHAIPGTGLIARDPYGGLLPRNRLFFDFSVRGPATGLAAVAKVTWALDGTVVREDPKAPFEWKGLSGSDRRMPAGDHTITVTVVPTAGDPAAVSFPLTATDCQPADFGAAVPRRASDPSTFVWNAAFESAAGEPLTGLRATATQNLAVALPRRLRGARIGTLRIGRRTYTLRGRETALQRGALRVRFTPGRRTFLSVTGLPAGTQGAVVKLVPGIARTRAPRSMFWVTGGFTAASGSVDVRVGGRYV